MAEESAKPERAKKLFKRYAKVLIGLGLALIAVVATGSYKLREEQRERERDRQLYRGTLGADRTCRFPLGDYCGPPPSAAAPGEPRACPDLATAQQLQPESLLEAYAGTCGDFRWIRWSTGFTGETSYFDSRGALVAVATWSDALTRCSTKSLEAVAQRHYGPVPTCTHVTTKVLKERPRQPTPP